MNDYYTNQNTQYPIFRAMKFQKGYGLGGVFKRLFKWIMPIVKEKAVPILQSVGKSVIKGTSKLAKDALKGKNIKQSANERFEETLKELSDKAGVMEGNGGIISNYNTPINKKKDRIMKIIRKKSKKSSKKRKRDIFDL